MDISFEDYSKEGGQLNQEGFLKAIEIRKIVDCGQKIKVGESSLKHAELLARSCSNVDKKQKDFYALWREKEDRLSDHRLFAEMLLVTGDIVNRQNFVSQFPHIFN